MIFAATVLLLLAMENSVLAQSTYAIYAPKYIRPGIEYSIDVEILRDYDGTVAVEAVLIAETDYFSTAAGEIKSGKSMTLVFDEIVYGYEGSTKFKLAVIGKDISTGKVVFNTSTSDIRFEKKFISIFIQTDKAIYQPGQTIKFRAVITTPDLTPFDGKASYKLQDPDGNVILRQRDAVLTQGVVGSQFKLGRYSTQGSWRISYEVHGYEESITVSVEEYKLPKFSVDINTDQSFLHAGSQSLTGEVKATYTFGQPVRGSGFVEITINKWWGTRVKPKILIKFPDFNGVGRFEIDGKTIEETLKWNPKHYSQPLSIFASVEEKNTEETFNETVSVDLKKVKMKVETLAKPAHIKPGLPYTAYLKISQQDGSPLSVVELRNMSVQIKTTYTFNYNWTLTVQKSPIEITEDVVVGEDGLIVFSTVAQPGNWDNVNFNVEIPSYPDKYQHWISWRAERFESPSNTFIQVTTSDTTLTAGDVATVTIATTETPPSDTYRISLVARGKVMKNELVTPQIYNPSSHDETYMSFDYKFDVMADYAPSVFVVVSFVRADGEFVADTVKINVQARLENEVTMTTSTKKTDAGQPVTITVSAAAGSFVGLRAIDQSVLLLKSGNDITRDKIFADLDRYGVSGGGGGFMPWRRGLWFPWPVGGGDVSEVFQNSGFIVLTDGLVYKSPPQYPMMAFSMRRRILGGNAVAAAAAGPPLRRALRLPATKTKIRKYFPETWIWESLQSGDNGSVTFNYNTPDTITTWELSSFAVSDSKGLGVTAANSKITVFRSFFISLNLPPSIVRGEILNMKTTLFNYFDTEITATLTLFENGWYELIIPSGATQKVAGPDRIVTIPSKDSVTVVFPIKFKKAGRSKISVKAQTELAGDAVERTLLVKPEGIPKIVSHSSIIDRANEGDPNTVITFDVDIPDDAVEGSSYAKIHVSGNILGSSLSNLGNLLQMPSGCGEQTMINFAPAVFISKYLKETGELTGEFKQKSQNFIQEGYQNELRYQRNDGSFSAFGSSDRSGSTWLTAFVVKCFIAANDLNPDLIEEQKIQRAVSFLLGQQNKDGTFNEPGRVIHKDMQGGVDSDETNAAYVLIALTEGNMYGEDSKDKRVKDVIAKTRKYLESRLGSIDDLYTLSIVAYALSLTESEETGKIVSLIDLRATVKTNVKYWQKEESGAAKCDPAEKYCPFDSNQPSSSSIEITSYNLLTYAKVGRIKEVTPIVRWLVQQRGAFGGYQSTQDTVMGIQALATVAGHFADRSLDMNVNVKHSGEPTFTADFKLNDDNAIVLQMAEVPNMSGTVTITATGVGVGDVQLAIGYNLPVGPRADEPFIVDVGVKKSLKERVQVEICSRINENRKEVLNGTGMYVVTFLLPSGYTINQQGATKNNKDAKLVELVGEEVTGYFDELPKGKTLCLSLELLQYAEVAGIKPKMIRVQDYYKPEFQAIRELRLESNEDPCSLCGSKCAGCKGLPAKPKCGEGSYPCPVFADGLFYDSGSAIMNLMKMYDEDSQCSAPNGAGDSTKYTGLPASVFDGRTQYITCDNSTYFESILKSRDGFTISMLTYPEELKREKYYVYYSIGCDNVQKPYVIFAKRPRSNQFWLKILLNGYQVIVRRIQSTNLPISRWRLITTRFQGTSAAVFINGIKVGRTFIRKLQTGNITSEVTLRIGRSHRGNAIRRGNYKGLVSNLNIWSTALTDNNIMLHYHQYAKMMGENNPILSKYQARAFIPQPIRQCFTAEEYSAIELKSREGKLDHGCKKDDDDDDDDEYIGNDIEEPDDKND